jgi:hypothetical protein
LVKPNEDPTEAHDLSASLPEVRRDMEAEFATFVARDGVIEPPPSYNALRQLLANNWQVLVRQMAGVLTIAAGVLVAVFAAVIYLLRRRYRHPLHSKPAKAVQP